MRVLGWRCPLPANTRYRRQERKGEEDTLRVIPHRWSASVFPHRSRPAPHLLEFGMAFRAMKGPQLFPSLGFAPDAVSVVTAIAGPRVASFLAVRWPPRRSA
jgi:hypothetical protein